VRETVDHGTLKSWEPDPYISDIGYVEDPTSNLHPTADELAAGATPGFKLDTGPGGSAVGQYTTVSCKQLPSRDVQRKLELGDG
jgi:hypothetical protein